MDSNRRRGKSVRLLDVAKVAGVSAVTVSNALSGKKGVSEELREKISKVSKELGYEPIVRSRQEDEVNGQYTIGVLISERYLRQSNSFYMSLYQHIVINATDKNCIAVLEVLDIVSEKNLVMPKLLENNTVEGIIVIGELKKPYSVVFHKISKAPVVFLDYYEEIENLDFIISDGYQGMYRMTNYLIQKGHKEIAFLGTLQATASITDRFLGYRKALIEHGIPAVENWVIDDRSLVDSSWVIELPEQMPTAFVCNCDTVAAILIGKLIEKGYHVPDDISVVGFDNYLFPPLEGLELTSYEVDVIAMSKIALRTILERIHKKDTQRGIHIIEGQMIIKDSVKEL